MRRIFFLIQISLGFNADLNIYKLFKYNGSSNYKFSSTFAIRNLFESYSNNLRSFSPVEFILRLSQKSLVFAISFEVNENSTINCNSYSSLTFLSTDILETPCKSI